jgi:hypothetical protein
MAPDPSALHIRADLARDDQVERLDRSFAIADCLQLDKPPRALERPSVATANASGGTPVGFWVTWNASARRRGAGRRAPRPGGPDARGRCAWFSEQGTARTRAGTIVV